MIRGGGIESLTADAAMAARKRARSRCGLCRKRIRVDDDWVTRVTDMAPIHLGCAMADPQVFRIVKEQL